MKTIETTIMVLSDGSIRIPPLPDLPPSNHRAVGHRRAARAGCPRAKPPLKLKLLDIPGWPADSRFRREEIYDDDGR